MEILFDERVKFLGSLVELGTNVLAGTSREGILEGVRQSTVKAEKASVPPKWDGKAAERIWGVVLG